MNDADINFYFDPLCPFAWMTSKWIRQVAARRDYAVDWRFISLRMLNAGVDYDSRFPAGYEVGHTAGLRLPRVAARTRAEHGRQAVGSLYEAIGTQAFDSAAAPALGPAERGSRSPRAASPTAKAAHAASTTFFCSSKNLVRRRTELGIRVQIYGQAKGI
jgi:hypothetical protein